LDPDAEPTPFDWDSAVVRILMSIESDTGTFAQTLDRWRPAVTISVAERQELQELETLFRELWRRYAPEKPIHADYRGKSVESENAAVDEYERKKREVWNALFRFSTGEDWRYVFSADDHAKMEAARARLRARVARV
jgi:hypothetical protein